MADGQVHLVLHHDSRSALRQQPARTARASRWINLIQRGVEEGRFETPSSRLSAYAMLRMGDVSLWFRADGPLSESEVAYYYGDMALRLVLARTAGTQAQATTPSPAHA